MSHSTNYKKKIRSPDFFSFPRVIFFELNKETDFSCLEHISHFEYKAHLLSSNNKFYIEDSQTLEEASHRVFFYNAEDSCIYSAFKATITLCGGDKNEIFFSENYAKLNCIFMLVTDEDCFMSCYLDRKLVAQKRIHRYTTGGGKQSETRGNYESISKAKGGPKRNLQNANEKELENDISSLMKSWSHHLEKVDIIFYQGFAIRKSALLSYFEKLNIRIEKLPFKITNSNGGFPRAYEELFTFTGHGTMSEFFDDLKDNTLFKDREPLNSAQCSLVSSVKGERRLEKQAYPTLNPEVKQRLHDAIRNDDYDGLLDIKDRATSQDELSQYLSSVHSKLNDQTFLHYAVRDNLPGVVQALLEMGCDPRIKDKTGKVACEIADKNMKEVFINFRLDNPNLYSWTKCHIPEPSTMNGDNRMKWKDHKDDERRRVKDHRKVKRESKLIGS